MTTFSQSGRVTDGRLVITCPESWRASLGRLNGQTVTVTVETEHDARSQKSNRYYWASVVSVFREIWSRGRVEAGLPPYTKEQTHDVLVRVLVGEEAGPKGTMMAMSTKGMDQDAFCKLIRDAKQMAWDDYQVRIPEPDEPWDVSL